MALPPGSTERCADVEDRFAREAETPTSVKRSNGVLCFGVDRVGSADSVVLELVPGETLDVRRRIDEE